MKIPFMLVALAALSACAGPQATAPKSTSQDPLCAPREESRPLTVIDGRTATVTSSNGTPVRQGTLEYKVKVPPPPDCGKPVAAAAPAPKPAPAAPAAAATFDPPAGEYPRSQSVTLSTTTPGGVIHYTTDGSTPTADSPTYTGPIPVEKNTNIQAIVVAPGAPSSAVSSGAYTIAPPPAPTPRVEVKKERLELKEVVLFETGKATIDQRSHSLLDEVATALKDHAEVKSVRIEGHTDDVGAAASNMKLSQARAEAVRKYLVDHGVAADRLAAKGFGESKPVASNKTAAGRATNRRVEFIIPQ